MGREIKKIDRLAADAFDSIDPKDRLKILNNVWCVDCRTVVGIGVVLMEVSGRDLVLKGSCTKCGGSVARVIEEVVNSVKPRSLRPVVAKNPLLQKLWEYSPEHKFSQRFQRLEALSIHFLGPFCVEDILSYYEDSTQIHHELKPIVEHASREMWEMQQIVPSRGSFEECPIYEGVELCRSGRIKEAVSLMKRLIDEEPRCIDAYAHIGNWMFNCNGDYNLSAAQKYYKMGMAVGFQAIGELHEAIFPWSAIDNRPFLRALHGFGLCCYKRGRIKDAKSVFTKMLWLNPFDNQGARFLLDDIAQGKNWEEIVGDE